jgi:hypothetical protein
MFVFGNTPVAVDFAFDIPDCVISEGTTAIADLRFLVDLVPAVVRPVCRILSWIRQAD